MRSILSILPLAHHLKILQLEQYQAARYLRWWLRNGMMASDLRRTSLKLTLRMKLIVGIGFLEVLGLMAGNSWDWRVGIITLLMWLLMPVPFLVVAAWISGLLVWFYERWVVWQIRATLKQSKVTVVGITGSYGKTSTKDYLYQLLDRWKYSLRTPESYNTILGINTVLKKELNNKHAYFVCELGAFGKGDIRRLSRMVLPTFGMVTGVGPQHLERFGSLRNTLQTKFELVDYVGKKKALVNGDNELIRTALAGSYKGVLTYGTSEGCNWRMKHLRMNTGGMKFEVEYGNQTYRFETRLFGTVHANNVLGAISMASFLGMPMELIVDEVLYLCTPPHRFELISYNDVMVIDNTYSSNVRGFEQMMQDVSKLSGTKALITPGVVELGKKTIESHIALGIEVAGVFETVVLVGVSERTRGLRMGLKQAGFKGKTILVKAGTNPWDVVKELVDNHQVMVMENDLPENYY